MPVRVLVVDDSAFMRGAIARVLSSDDRFEVVGQASDGTSAVQMARDVTPDVITMDFNMPGMNGAEATRAILAERGVPIVMLSAHTRQGATATVEALAAGAVDFVEKPDGEVSANLSGIRDALIDKLLQASGANVRGGPAPSMPMSEPTSSRRKARAAARPIPAGQRLVVIASSTGGPAALVNVLPSLGLDAKASLIIVQHMSAGFTEALAAQLSERAAFPVKEARGGEELAPGSAFVAQGGAHLVVERGARLSLSTDPPVHGVRPAADVTLKSAAQVFGARAIGVVLTGMGRDGAMGLAAIKAAGGRTVAQDKDSSTVYGMPRAAVELGVVDEVVPLGRVGRVVSRLVTD
ncbi:MAG: chemotaxis response regulator protein-glutamate methylesterase [Polyangiaceae bacterium]